MENKSKNGSAEQGSVTPVIPESEFKKMVENDLKTSVSFIMAIVNDEPTKSALTDYLYGRYMNAVHKKELEAQTKMGI